MNMIQQQNDFNDLEYICKCASARFNIEDFQQRLNERLRKLHYYEWIHFNGADSDDAQQKIMCSNSEEDFIAIDLGDFNCES